MPRIEFEHAARGTELATRRAPGQHRLPTGATSRHFGRVVRRDDVIRPLADSDLLSDAG
jgi:hypothetical protein